MSGLNTRTLLDGVVSNAMQLGLFDKVNLHEPKRKPGAGMTVSIWADHIQPMPQFSGLNQSSALVVFMFRIYQNMLMEPQDLIDTVMVEATDTVIAQYSGEFTLNGAVREIDLLGESGTPLSAQAGYLNVDGVIYRIMDITIPLIINDAWTQDG